VSGLGPEAAPPVFDITPSLPPEPRGHSALVAPYHPPPVYAPAAVGVAAVGTDARGAASLAVAIIAIVLGLPFGLPGLALGTFAYFLGKAAIARIDASHGTMGGRGLAVAGWVLGVVATAVGAVVSLGWVILLLMAASAPS
jgi:hypothetical protein